MSRWRSGGGGVRHTPGRQSTKRAREEEDEAVIPDESSKSGRLCKGEPIAEEQPILLTGAVMRDYQVIILRFWLSR